MIEYLDTFKFLPHKQSGFRAGRSTATALLDVIDDILCGQDMGEGTILVLLDFSRAFDCINIDLLLSKLTFYGFDNATVKWFASYLSGRTQRVEVVHDDGSKVNSSASPVTAGVPQGSILGPILFILYSADIIECLRNCRFHLYADDLQMYITFKPNETAVAVERLNEDLKRVVNWSYKNGLLLNPVKSKYLVLGSKFQIDLINTHTPNVLIEGTSIEQVTEARNLGIVMDGGLKFEKHISEVAQQCYYRLRVLYHIRQYLSVDVRIRLCESLILSKLNYADTVIGGCLLSRTKRLIQRVQNACVRFCFPIPYREHITPYINHYKIMNMQSRRSLHFACLLFGIVKTHNPSYLFEKLQFSHRPCRDASRLVCSGHRTAAFRGSFRYLSTKCWNNIPPPLRNSATVGSFKNNLKNIFNTSNVYYKLELYLNII